MKAISLGTFVEYLFSLSKIYDLQWSIDPGRRYQVESDP